MNLFDLYGTSTHQRKKRVRKTPSQFRLASRVAESKSLGFYTWPWNLPVPVHSIFEAFRLFITEQELLIVPRKRNTSPPTPKDLVTKTQGGNPFTLFRFTLQNWPERILNAQELKRYNGKQRPEERAKIGDGFFQRVLPYVARIGGNEITSTNWETAVRYVQAYRFAPPDILFVDRKPPYANAVGRYELCELQDGTRFYVAYTNGMSAQARRELQKVADNYKAELERTEE